MSIEVPETLIYTNAKGKEIEAKTLTKAGNIAVRSSLKAIKLIPVHNPIRPALAKPVKPPKEPKVKAVKPPKEPKVKVVKPPKEPSV